MLSMYSIVIISKPKAVKSNKISNNKFDVYKFSFSDASGVHLTDLFKYFISRYQVLIKC